MTPRRALGSLVFALAAAAVGNPARAAPVDAAGICGSLFAPAIIARQAPRAVQLQWSLLSQQGNVVTLRLALGDAQGWRRYDGFRCAVGANGAVTPLASRPIPVSGEGQDR